MVFGIYTFISYINNLAKNVNKWVMTIIALLISALIAIESNTAVIFSLWSLFILLSLIFAINGIMLIYSFNREVNKYLKAGTPVQGIRGYDELVDSLKGSMIQSSLITLASALSFIFFLATIEGWIEELSFVNDTNKLMVTLALAMTFVAVSIMFLVEYPEDPSFTPGGLVKYYEPDQFDMYLDNILSDVISTYLDPVTFLKFDDWSSNMLEILKPSFENDEDQTTRLERARENIFLLAYLNSEYSSVFNDEIVMKELDQLFGDKLQIFISGDDIGLTWSEVKDIIDRVEDIAPEPFRLVDRLLINLTDNYKQFSSKDLYFTVSAKSYQGSVRESAGMIAFLLNLTDKTDRIFKVWLNADINTMSPHKQSVTIKLDGLTDPLPKEQPPLITSEGEDILSVLSDLLQVGDAVWFRLQSSGFGYRVVTIQAQEEGTAKLFGKSYEMKFTKSIGWYIKSYLPKLSALGSLALPFIGLT
jgi:hypothetical protein